MNFDILVYILHLELPYQGNGGGVREPQGQEFDSWRHQQQPHQPGFNPMSSLASDPYGFYQQSQAFHHYPGFGVGEGRTGEYRVMGVSFFSALNIFNRNLIS